MRRAGAALVRSAHSRHRGRARGDLCIPADLPALDGPAPYRASCRALCAQALQALAALLLTARKLPDQCDRSEEHTSELQSLMRNSYAVFCLTKKNIKSTRTQKQLIQTTI